MTQSHPLRGQRRAASEQAILDAAWSQFARVGPDGISLRELARDAGCSHTLLGRYFGSKDGLVTAVSDRLTSSVAATVEAAWASEDPLVSILSAARDDRSCVRLLVRCGLGDLRPAGFPECLGVGRLLQRTQDNDLAGGGATDRRSRLLAYGASSLLLGWLTFEAFLVAAVRLGRVSSRHRDAALAAAAGCVMGLAGSADPPLEVRDGSGGRAASGSLSDQDRSSSERLVASAIVLFAERGPASVSVRDIGRHAGVNQGLIYRHFGSKDALLAAAIQQGTSALLPAALADDGFDFDLMSHLLHRSSPAPRLLARTIVDGIRITAVRQQFPVLRRLLDGFDQVPAATDPVVESDPRLAVASVGALALGSVIWVGPSVTPWGSRTATGSRGPSRTWPGSCWRGPTSRSPREPDPTSDHGCSGTERPGRQLPAHACIHLTTVRESPAQTGPHWRSNMQRSATTHRHRRGRRLLPWRHLPHWHWSWRRARPPTPPPTPANGPDLTITVGGGRAEIGSSANYHATVSSVGTQATAGTVTATLVAPPGQTISAATGSGWDCTIRRTRRLHHLHQPVGRAGEHVAAAHRPDHRRERLALRGQCLRRGQRRR